jgi:hypothetical protein
MKLRMEGSVLLKTVETILLILIICNQFYNTVSGLDQWYSTYFVRVPPDVISLQLCTPKLLVYNSSQMQSIIYI